MYVQKSREKRTAVITVKSLEMPVVVPILLFSEFTIKEYKRNQTLSSTFIATCLEVLS